MSIVSLDQIRKLKKDIEELPGLIEELRDIKFRLRKYFDRYGARSIMVDVLDLQLRLEQDLKQAKEEYDQAKNS